MKTLTIMLLTVVLSLPAQPVRASAECAIWLCLPFGFVPPSCGSARSAMLRRISRFKSPAPSFNSCQVRNPRHTNRYTLVTHQAVLMGSYYRGSVLIRPDKKIIDYGSCNHPDSGPEEPRGCRTTLQAIRLYENGVQMGLTYYRNKEGRDYVADPVTGVISRAQEEDQIPTPD